LEIKERKLTREDRKRVVGSSGFKVLEGEDIGEPKLEIWNWSRAGHVVVSIYAKRRNGAETP
jgi:hypothetical protein